MKEERFPCPTVGCEGEGRSIRMGAFEVRVPCWECAAAADALAEAEEEGGRQRDLLEALARGNARMREWTLSTYPKDGPGAAAAAAGESWLKSYLDGERRNLILRGTVGAGKTGLAWSLAVELCRQGVPARLVNFRDALADARAAVAERRPADRTWWRVAVLALDDLGAERPTPFALDELSTLVEQRYTRMLPMVVTSNYSQGDLADRLSPDGDTVVGKRIVSRLTEGSVKVEFGGKDRRL